MKKKIVAFIMATALAVTAAPVRTSAATYLYTKVAGADGFDMNFSGNIPYGRHIYVDSKKGVYRSEAWFEPGILINYDVVRGWHKDYDFKLLVKNSKKKVSETKYKKTGKEKRVSVVHTGSWVQYEFYVYK